MARSKSTTTTPKAKKVTVPQSAPAKPAVLAMRSPSPEISDADSAPVAAATTTPARKQAKRKAPLDDDDDNATSTLVNASSKKSRVTIHTEQATVTSTTTSGKKSTHKQRNVHIEIPIASTPKGKHIVFDNDDQEDGDDGPSEFFTPQEDKKTDGLDAQLLLADNKADGEEEDEDSDDDDDEAPEAVSTSTAAAQAAKATQAAARAAELQQDDVRRKRQERDAKFKKQAEARRLQQQESAAAAAPAPSADGQDDSDDDDDDEPTATKEQPASRLVTSLSTSSRKRLDRRNLPSVLPDEFLESDEEDEAEVVDESSSARPKKITFNTAARQVATAEPRHPADQRVGSTVYRVMKKQGESKLAPRGGKYSKNAREMMLGRGRTVPRTSVKKKGFLVKS